MKNDNELPKQIKPTLPILEQNYDEALAVLFEQQNAIIRYLQSKEIKNSGEAEVRREERERAVAIVDRDMI